MENPFQYGDPVLGQHYLERAALKNSVLSFVKNKINLVLIGPRRYGKTSFILDLCRSLEREKYDTVFVDVFNVTSHRDFLNQLILAIRNSKSQGRRVTDWLKKFVKTLKPSLNLDLSSTDSAQLKITLQTHKLDENLVKELIQDALDSLNRTGQKTFVAFDEFQTIGQLDDKGWLEATLRTKMQMQKNVSFLFSGSRQGIIHSLFNDSSRPFYRSCQLIDFPRFGPEFTNWIIKRFKTAGRHCPPAVVDHLRQLVDDTPNYVQMVCFHIIALGIKKTDKAAVEQALKKITAQNSYPYQTLLNALSIVQQRVLKLAACENQSVYKKEVFEKYEIASPQHVAQGIKSLIDKQILDESTARGVVIFDDPLFKIWLRQTFGATP